MNFGSINIEWLGHASFKIRGTKLIYTDPYRIRDSEQADIILITHEHYDHCSPEDIEKIQGSNTIIVATEDCASKLKGDVRTVKPGDTLEIEGVKIEAVPAYNIDKEYHPKEKNWVGYVIDIDNQKVYQAGDTDVIPEMDEIEADIAILPVGGMYTMNAGEAAEAVNKINPIYVIPMHWGSIVGSKEDAEELKRLVDAEVVIMEPKS